MSGVFVREGTHRRHDYGTAYADQAKTSVLGKILYCVTTKYDGGVSVNIADFQEALRQNYYGVLFAGDLYKKLIPMNRAKELMENARQLDGTDYKIIHWDGIRGKTTQVYFPLETENEEN